METAMIDLIRRVEALEKRLERDRRFELVRAIVVGLENDPNPRVIWDWADRILAAEPKGSRGKK